MSKCNMLILGDICPDWGFPRQFATGKAESVFHDILPLLTGADVVLANLEAPLTDETRKLKKNSVCLKGRPADAALLAAAGITGVSLANNHILDYGPAGYRDTLRVLEENGIVHYGTMEREGTHQPAFFSLGDRKIGVLSFAEHEFNCAADYGVGACCWEDLTGPRAVAEAKQQCDFLIVQYHGGIEHHIYPSPVLQRKCRVMAEMGADFVTCQHSHCIGTREKWAGCEILYGQGNTVFGYKENKPEWNSGLMVELLLHNGVEINYIPITASPEGEILADPVGAKEILNRFNAESAKITDAGFVKSEWDRFCASRRDMYLPLAFARGRIFNKLNRITGGRLVRLFTTASARGNVMNLIRCDAHREVMQTLLEKDYYAE